jgi:hypothetical protein
MLKYKNEAFHENKRRNAALMKHEEHALQLAPENA